LRKVEAFAEVVKPGDGDRQLAADLGSAVDGLGGRGLGSFGCAVGRQVGFRLFDAYDDVWIAKRYQSDRSGAPQEVVQEPEVLIGQIDAAAPGPHVQDRKSTRLNSSHVKI